MSKFEPLHITPSMKRFIDEVMERIWRPNPWRDCFSDKAKEQETEDE